MDKAKITDDIKYVGVNDHDIDLFEGQYRVPLGMSYNSYVIMDEKIAVVDTVDSHFGEEWLKNLKETLGENKPSYLIIEHMEPDHSSNIGLFLKEFPDTTVVSSDKAFVMMKNFFSIDFADGCKKLSVKDGSTLELGKHTLTFIAAPMVHWPEVMMVYDSCDKALFAADGFGKFGANDLPDPEGWACEARRYYFGIVGKYGAQVQSVLKKAKNLEISRILSLHGPVLNENLSYYIGLYDTWSSYRAEDEGTAVFYSSVYGNTEKAAQYLYEELKRLGTEKVVISDLARSDFHENIEDAFRYSRMVLCSPTYNGDMFPHMKTFLESLIERGYKNRRIGIVENGSWAPMAGKAMKKMIEEMKGIDLASTVTIMSGLTEENKVALTLLAEELLKK